jgi:hypothetical protein
MPSAPLSRNKRNPDRSISMKTSPSLHVAAFAAFATLLGARAAHAEPSTAAKSQLRMGFVYCDKGNPAKYFSQRDFAFKADPTLRAWNGKIKSYSVPETLTRCDASMRAKAAEDAHRAEVTKAWEALSWVCERKDSVAVTSEKAAFLAKNGGDASFPLERGRNARDAIAKCEADLRADKARRDKLEADLAKSEEDRRAREKASDDAQAAREAAAKAVFDKLKGDRLAIAKKLGLPSTPASAQVPKATSWTYSEYRGGRGELQGHLCKTVITFKGDKKTSEKNTGPGCKL